MTLITRHILRQIWLPAMLASVVISFLVIAGAVRDQIALLMDEYPIVQLSLGDISLISLYVLPTLVGFIFPITFLLGILLTFSTMAQHLEITALKAAGVPLKRLLAPILVAGVLLSGVCFVFQNLGQPWAYARLKHLMNSDLPLRVTLDMLPTGVIHHYGDWRVYIGGKDGEGRLRDIAVFQPQENGEATAFYAQSAALVKEGGRSQLEMRNGLYIKPSGRGEDFTRAPFEVLRKTVPKLETASENEARQALRLGGLLKKEAEMTRLFEETESIPVALELRKFRIEISERFSFPLMCLAVAFVAAPVGARTKRSGRSYTFLSGLLIIGSYFVLRKVMEPPFLPGLGLMLFLGQIPNLALTLIGGVLIWRVDRV